MRYCMILLNFIRTRSSLCQNTNNILPLNASRIRSLVVFGDNDTIACGGSGHVNAEYIVTPFDVSSHTFRIPVCILSA